MPPAALARLAAALAAAYALGGVSPGWWLVRRAGSGDVRTQGSGGTGATNVGRVLGERGFLAVLALDAAKAALAVLGARLLAPGSPWHVLALPAVIAGHIWPVWLGFRGGRGAAPLLGGSLAMRPALPLSGVALGLTVIFLTRNRFLGGLVAFVSTLVLMGWILPSPPERAAYLLACGLVVLAHRDHFAKYLPL